jgi:hypothetical protein
LEDDAVSERDDGGPAFPCIWGNDGDQNAMAPDGSVVPPGHATTIPGMSLRDYFAAKAMLGYLAYNADVSDNNDKLAEWSYATADAMLKARKGGPT